MSDSAKPEQTPPTVRPEERELPDESLDSVAGGCQIGVSVPDPIMTMIPLGPCFPQPDVSTF